MIKNQQLPEVFTSSTATSAEVRRRAQKAQVRKIGPRLYTSNMSDDIATIVRRNLWRVVELLAPGTVVGYRTGFEVKPAEDGSVFVVGAAPRTIEVPGLRLTVIRGPGVLEGDQPFLGLHLASRARAILESLRRTRTHQYASRSVKRNVIEDYLETTLRTGGETRLNELRDQARALIPRLNAEAEFETLDKMIGALLGTRKTEITSAVALARIAGMPYDPHRLELFHTLHAALVKWGGQVRPDRTASTVEFANGGFFDAYFSNYIEGTEFEVEEAREIIFDNKIPAARPKDAHDILGTYRLVGNKRAMSRSVRDDPSPETFIERVRLAHATILEMRPEKRPGEFKEKANKAGNTHFVQPDLVRGTLAPGVELARGLVTPFARAVMLMFVLSEVHPFDDGNGRVARAFMNAELIAGGETRIVIPTVYREEYLTGLRTLSRTSSPDAYIQILDYAQEYTSRIDFTDYDGALATLTATNAFEEPESASALQSAGADAKLRMPPERQAIPEPLLVATEKPVG